MKLENTYKFPQFAKPIVATETTINTFVDENEVIHLDVVFTSETPNRGVYLGTVETLDNLEQVVIERLEEFEL